jgi:hypothetical protein
VNLAEGVELPWYGNGAWVVGIALALLWLLYVIGKIRRGKDR